MSKAKASELLQDLISLTADPVLNDKLKVILSELSSDDISPQQRKQKAKRVYDLVAKLLLKVGEHAAIGKLLEELHHFFTDNI